MLKLTHGGRMIGGEAAVEFLEMLPDNIPDEIKDDDFCDEYEFMLNRVRYEVAKSVPVPAKRGPGKTEYFICGKCGATIHAVNDVYCAKCGRAIGWKSVFPWRTV
jgi:ribosomal protein L37E